MDVTTSPWTSRTRGSLHWSYVLHKNFYLHLFLSAPRMRSSSGSPGVKVHGRPSNQFVEYSWFLVITGPEGRRKLPVDKEWHPTAGERCTNDEQCPCVETSRNLRKPAMTECKEVEVTCGGTSVQKGQTRNDNTWHNEQLERRNFSSNGTQTFKTQKSLPVFTLHWAMNR